MGLSIHLLGQFKLDFDGRLVNLPSRPAQSLFAYLVLNPNVTQRREKLAGLLWPEASESNARAYLRQALWRIRKALAEAGLQWEQYLRVDDINIAFESSSCCWIDTAELLSPLEEGTVEEVRKSVSLYGGELLPGFYDEWVVGERERLQAAYRRKMDLLLARLIDAGEWNEALVWSEEWLRLDHAPEPAFRALMLSYAGLGNPGMAAETYRRCAEALERELGVEPAAETRAVYERIRQRAVGRVETNSALRARTLPPFLKEGMKKIGEQPVFVARERELAALETALNSALAGHGRVIFVTGEAGAGKTALLQAFGQRALLAHDTLVVAGGQCNAHTGIGDPYLPLREILALLTGDVESRWKAGAISGEHAQRLWQIMPMAGQALVENGPDLIDTLLPGPALLERMAASAAHGAAWFQHLQRVEKGMSDGSLMRGAHQDDLFEQVTRMMQALSEKVPLLLFLDDLQWADLGSISLLFHLGRNLRGWRILVAGAYRPEEVALGRDSRQHPLSAAVHELQREFGEILVNVNQAQSQEFVEALVDSERNRLGLPFRQMLYRQTQGNPLFTIELLRGMQARGDLVQNAAGEWTESERLAWELLPARVEAVIAQRIERLDGELQAVLQAASVEGELFTAEVVSGVLGVSPQHVLARLSGELDRVHRLVRARSVERLTGGLLSTFSFRHIQIQKYLYGTLDDVQRVYLHQQVGIMLEALYDEEAKMVHAVQLARHFEEARSLERAVHYRYLAGKQAMQMFAFKEAIAHLSTGVALLKSLPDTQQRMQQELDMQLATGMAWLATGNPAVEMGQAFDRARALSRQIGKTEQLASAIGGQAIVHYVRAEHERARMYAQEALALANEVQDPLLIMLAHWYVGFIHYAMGKYREALTHLEAVLSIYVAEQHHRRLVRLRGVDPGLAALSYEVCCLWCLGYPDQAMQKRDQVMALAHELNHVFTLGDVLCYAGCALDALRQDGYAMQAHALELIQLAEEKGMPGWLKMANCYLAQGMALSGSLEEGIARMEAGIAARSSSNEKVNTVGVLCAVAESHLRQGQIAEAKAALARAQSMMERTGERQWAAELCRTRAELCLAMGDELGAMSSYGEGIRVAQEQEARWWELRSATGLARLWLRQGKRGEAQRLLAKVTGWFQEGFDTADLREAKDLLNEMAR